MRVLNHFLEEWVGSMLLGVLKHFLEECVSSILLGGIGTFRGIEAFLLKKLCMKN